MTSSSNSSIDHTRFENVQCRYCGLRALVVVSKSTNNPRRLYYRCKQHGWVKWVMSNTRLNEDTSDGHSRMLPRVEPRVGSEYIAYPGHNMRNWNVPLIV